jgi:hypothetical protein
MLPRVGFPTFVGTLRTRPTGVSECFLWNSAFATGHYTGESSEGDMGLWRRWCWRPKPSGMYRPIDLHTVTGVDNDMAASISIVEQRRRYVAVTALPSLRSSGWRFLREILGFQSRHEEYRFSWVFTVPPTPRAPQNRVKLPIASLPIHYSSIIPTFDATEYENMKLSLKEQLLHG